MKLRILSTARLSFPLATALAALLAAQSVSALTYYWDQNDVAPGFGAAGGTWDSIGSSTWNETADGTTGPIVSTTTVAADIVNFGTGTVGGGLTTGSIAVGTVNAGTINFGFVSDAITLSGGTISLASGGSITARNTGTIINSAITLEGAGTIAYGRGSSAVGNFTVGGQISGGTGMTFTTSSFNSGNNLQTILLNSANTYGGDTLFTTVTLGNTVTLKAGIANALPTGTVLTIDGGTGSGSAGRTITYDLGGFSQTLVGLQNTTGLIRRNQRVTSTAPAALTINNTADFSFGGTASDGTVTTTSLITGAIALTKEGAGTFTLNATTGNTYTGGTTISQGKLIAQGTQTALGATGGAVSVAASGTLQINQNNATPNTTFAVPQAISGAGTLEFSGLDAPAINARRLITLAPLTGFTGNISILANGNYLADTTNDTTNQNLTIATGGYLTISGSSSVSINAGFGTLNGDGIIMRNAGGVSTSTLTLGNNNATGGVFSGTIRGESTAASSGLFGSSGLIAVTKVGTGTQTLSGQNIYTGTTTVSDGTLVLGNAGSNTLANTGAVVIGDVAGANLQLDFNETIGSLAGGGTTGGAVNLQGNALTVGNANNTTFAGGISGTSGSLVKQGAGILTLSGTNSYTGGSTVTAGGLVFGSLAAKPAAGTHAFGAGTTLGLGVGGAGFFDATDIDNAFSGTMTGNLSNVTVTTTTNVGVDTSAGNFIFGASVAGSPTKGLVKLGANDLTLSGANTFTGPTTIIAGTLTLSNALALQNSPLVLTGAGTVVLSGVTTLTLGGLSGAGGLDVTGLTNLTLNPLSGYVSYSGNITDGTLGMTVTKSGAGAQFLGGTNIYTGATQIDGGILVFGNKAAKAGATATAAAAGSIGLGVHDTTATFYSAAEVGALFNATLTGFSLDTASGVAIDTTNAGGTFDQTVTLTAARALTKLGAGTLTLSTANSYNGGTSITGGLVSVTDANALGSGNVTFNGGTRLSIAGGLTVANNLTIGTNSGGSSRGMLESSGTGTATLGGNITINNSATAGGHFASTTGNDLVLSGVITSSVNVTQRIGTVTFSGGGTGYTNLDVTGSAKVGALDGIATTATVNIGASSAGTLDLNGVNQSLVGITKGGSAATIGSSSTTADSVLTTTGTSSYGGTIVNSLSGGTRTVSLTVASGALTLTGNNTYTGATTVNNGTLSIATGYLSLTTPINVASGAFLTTSRNNTFSGGGAGQPSGVWTIAGTITQTASGSTMPASVTLNNGTMSGVFNAAFGTFLAVGSGTTITANGATNTIDAGNLGLFAGLTVNTPLGTDALAISSQLGGTSAKGGGLTKTGDGTVTLSGANTYAGNTTVSGGTLTLSNAPDPLNANLANDLSTVIIADNGTSFLNLTFTGTDKVDKLFFGATQQPSGTYSASSVPAGATITTASFPGTGTLTVGAGFSSWITNTFINGTVPLGQRGPNDDPDNDGISNLVEFAIAGQDPTVGKTDISTFDGTTLSFTKRLPLAASLTYAIQESTDLGISLPWAAVTGTPPTYVNDGTTISYSLTPGTPAKNFLRLQVLSN